MTHTNYIYTDIAVIGGGAAGLTAAIFAARSGAEVLLLERGQRFGKKLVTTGNGRCNLSHSPLGMEHFHGEKKLARYVFDTAMSAEEFFMSLGVKCRTEPSGNVYPFSNTASAVIDALRFEIDKLGICSLTDFQVAKAQPLIEGFKLFPPSPISEDTPIIVARRVIAATGGLAAPSTGSDGTFFNLLGEQLGISVLKPLPTLCPIKTSDSITRPLKGVRAFASCSAILDGKVLKTEVGELQFQDGALSGICIFNLSRYAALHPEKLVISVDLAPQMEMDELLGCVKSIAAARKGVNIEDLLTGLFNKRIAISLLKQVTQKPMTQKADTLTDKELESLVLLAKDWRFPVLQSHQWANAQCTSGGVASSELGKGLCAKKYPHLFFAGEMVNVDGDCGGYNLAWAWASGEVAGRNAALSLKG